MNEEKDPGDEEEDDEGDEGEAVVMNLGEDFLGDKMQNQSDQRNQKELEDEDDLMQEDEDY